eukprot:GHRQ01032557.1.p1 GENE.GHRQ01032557.1~~GHRQ01032557.1.p1  ORF type:complete len:164 (-),score=29.10 GHRQ01032557.1:12-503(-)
MHCSMAMSRGHVQRRHAPTAGAAAARPLPLLLPCRPSALTRSRLRTFRIQAAAAAVSYSDLNGSSSATWQANKAYEVAPLPAPPKSGQSLTDVLPYLFKLALSEKQLKWRLGAAFACMLVSKAAGGWEPHNGLAGLVVALMVACCCAIAWCSYSPRDHLTQHG